jgi:predicted aminopeptidase
VKSATPFNESFAQMTGYQAAEEFFRSRGDSLSAGRARDRRHDEKILAEFYNDLIPRLERFYASKPSPDSLDAFFAALGLWVRELLEVPFVSLFGSVRVSRPAARPINNATLIGVRIYRTNLEWFDRWYAEHGSSVKASVAALRELMDGAEGDSAFARLERAVGAADLPRDSVPSRGPETEH